MGTDWRIYPFLQIFLWKIPHFYRFLGIKKPTYIVRTSPFDICREYPTPRVLAPPQQKKYGLRGRQIVRKGKIVSSPLFISAKICLIIFQNEISQNLTDTKINHFSRAFYLSKGPPPRSHLDIFRRVGICQNLSEIVDNCRKMSEKVGKCRKMTENLW